MEEQGGGPQEMAFVRAGAGQFRAQTRTPACAHGPLHHKPPSGQHAPPLSNLARFPGSLGTRPGKRKPFLAPEDLTFSPGHTSQQFCAPASSECPGRTWGPGARAGPSHGHGPGEEGQGGRSPRPWKGSPGGTQACAPPGPLRVLLWLKLPHPAPRCQTWTHLPPLSNICPKLLEKGL